MRVRAPRGQLQPIRVSGDGAFSSRRRTGEGLLPSARHLGRLEVRISYGLCPSTNPVSVIVGQSDPSPGSPRQKNASGGPTSPLGRGLVSRFVLGAQPKMWDMRSPKGKGCISHFSLLCPAHNVGDGPPKHWGPRLLRPEPFLPTPDF
jgi:hypothetical protein